MSNRFSQLQRYKYHWVWRGKGGLWKGVLQFAWVAIRFWLAQLLWGTAVRLAHFPPPTNNLGVIIAIVAFLLLVWGVWGIWQTFVTLGMCRILLALAAAYLLFLVVNMLTVPDERPFANRAIVLTSQTTMSIGEKANSTFQNLLGAPDEFLFAYTGIRKMPDMPPGFPTPDSEATPIIIKFTADDNSNRSLRPTPTASTKTAVTPTTNLEEPTDELQFQIDANSNVRAGPGTEYDVIGFVSQGEVYAVLEIDSSQNWYKIELSPEEIGWIGTSRGSVYSP